MPIATASSPELLNPELVGDDESRPFDWPVFGLQDDVRGALAKAMTAGAPLALATLYAVSGGTPRGVGAQMLLSGKEMAGFLSGGCTEADVALHAEMVLADGRPRHLTYGDGGPIDIRLPCGARIDILLEAIGPNDEAALRLMDLTARRRPALWLTNGTQRACFEPSERVPLPSELKAVALLARGAANGGICAHRDAPFSLFRAFTPPLRLIIVGGDPIALALVRISADIGLDTVLVRPHGPEGPAPGGVRYFTSDAKSAFESLAPDPWTALAIVTHDLDQEHAALSAAFKTSAGYIGALGSLRRIPARNARLIASGVPQSKIDMVHAPIGLPLRGKSPWEIAIAIVAEVFAETAGATVG